MKPPKLRDDAKLPFYKDKKKLVTISIASFFIIIMATSILELYVGNRNQENIYDYNGVKFTDVGNGWLAYLDNGRQLYIVSSPKELENVTLAPLNLGTINYAEKIYLSYDPKNIDKMALSEFLREVKLTPRIVYACPKDSDLCRDMPLKACEDATLSAAVILIQQANDTSVTFINNCLSIQGKDLTKVVDKLILVTQA